MKARRLIISALVAIFLCMMPTGCDNGSRSSTDPVLNPDLIYEGWWMSYAETDHFGHDGETYQTENFVIYSDACEMAEKKRVAGILEDLLLEHMNRLSIVNKDVFIYTTSDRRLHCYFSKYLAFAWGGGFYSTNGFMLYSIDSPLQNWPYEAYNQILRHELLHVIGALLSGGIKGDAWFIEGIAEHVSEISGLKPLVTCKSQIQEWMIQQQNDGYGGNPIAIHSYEDVRNSDPNATGNYDPYFELAVRYLLDPQGHGRTWLDIKQIFLDMREDYPIATAFADNMDMGLGYYEANFFSLMLDYLPD